MRVNIYAEEITNRVELVTKTIDGVDFVGIRFYLELPVTLPPEVGIIDGCMGVEEYIRQSRHVSGPFIHREGDDDSAAVTFWGKKDCRELFKKALDLLDNYYTKM